MAKIHYDRRIEGIFIQIWNQTLTQNEFNDQNTRPAYLRACHQLSNILKTTLDSIARYQPTPTLSEKSPLLNYARPPESATPGMPDSLRFRLNSLAPEITDRIQYANSLKIEFSKLPTDPVAPSASWVERSFRKMIHSVNESSASTTMQEFIVGLKPLIREVYNILYTSDPQNLASFSDALEETYIHSLLKQSPTLLSK
ncbi:MAG: hypothetical protein IPP74_00445 [Alphaproteobacteria bacterium]|nr:hypothetical protein [Alphaproteobacteria bacterium]